MAFSAFLDRLGLGTVPSTAVPLDGDLAALDPSTSPLHLTDAVLGSGTSSAIGDVASDPLLDPQETPLVGGLNGTVLDVHAAIEGSGDQTGTIGATHGLTNLGETVGLGRIGGDNLVTHAIDAPGDLVAGNLSDVTAVPADVGNIADAGVYLVNGTLSDVMTADSGGAAATAASLLDGGAESAIAPVTTSPLLDPTANPLATAANDAVLDVHASIEGAGDATGIIGTTHGLTGLGETIGLGEIGGDNLLTHGLDAPGDILAGDLGDVTAIPSDVANIGTAATNLVDGVASDAGALASGNGLVGALDGGTTGGEGALGGLATDVGLGQTGTALGGIGTLGAGGLVGDVQHVATDALGDVPVLTGTAGALGAGAGADGQAGAGALPSLASLFGTGAAPGAHDAADASAGPSGTGGGVINVLGTPVTDGHALDVHALALPAGAPAGVAVAALGDNGLLHFGSTGSGGDALTGVLSQAAATVTHAEAAPEAAPAHAEMPIDLHGVAGLDQLLTHHA